MSERIPCIACGYDFEAENIKEDGRCTICTHHDFGYWVKECPTKPGWYWIMPKAKFQFVTIVWFEPDFSEYYTLRNKTAHPVKDAQWWWSREIRPPMPPRNQDA